MEPNGVIILLASSLLITLMLNVIKTLSSGIFVFFWVFYVFIAALEAYGVIDPGF